MQHNFTFINILKVIFDKYWGRGALMQSSQLLSDRLKESKLRKLAVRSTSVRLPNDWSLADGAGQCSAFIVAALIIAFEVTTKLRG